ncbi:MAG: hypothetical protein V4461_04030 [Pseudomonadota bacterium]
MGRKRYSDELERALARRDADQMCRDLDAYADHHERGGEWPEEYAEAFGEIISCFHDDPEKAFAYVILGASRSDDAGFLGLLGCGPLEDLLDDPSDELLERIIAEARKSARFRWLLSHPFKVAIAQRAWEAIEKFRITGPHEEPSKDALPPRQ